MLILVSVGGLAIIGIAVLVWAERAEDREQEKLRNYRQAEAIQRARGKFTTVEYYPRGI